MPKMGEDRHGCETMMGPHEEGNETVKGRTYWTCVKGTTGLKKGEATT
jgi:hypothetical protein